MPIYEFQCQKCKKIFETLLLSSSPEAKAKIRCPDCSSREVKKAISATNIGSSSASPSLSGMPSIGNCNPGSGFS
ncbi:MAG: FmdB family zinc ribbon protein [Thermodesulfobacteriota bacterium]